MTLLLPGSVCFPKPPPCPAARASESRAVEPTEGEHGTRCLEVEEGNVCACPCSHTENTAKGLNMPCCWFVLYSCTFESKQNRRLDRSKTEPGNQSAQVPVVTELAEDRVGIPWGSEEYQGTRIRQGAQVGGGSQDSGRGLGGDT